MLSVRTPTSSFQPFVEALSSGGFAMCFEVYRVYVPIESQLKGWAPGARRHRAAQGKPRLPQRHTLLPV
ncbi:hypothetical protein EVAR_28193_1 [Eumeta japonica]|uniref:Uncharacterized protein n=1 Tax=Eumeta variegata TaxID=151549 RepID=A0A4C1VJD0_EUMVA|nr:hypothetical protein EVAR_28193_1 [Eumeta japonica]